MVHAVKAGARQLGIRAEHRLKGLEDAAGLRDYQEEQLTKVAGATALAEKRGDPKAASALLEQMNRSSEAEMEWRDRAIIAETRLADLQSGMRALLDRSYAYGKPPGKPGASSKLPSDVVGAGERVAGMLERKPKA